MANKEGLTPHGYQERAIQFGIEHKNVFFAIDLGLGKTLVGLEIIDRTEPKAIVIAPLSVIYNTWPDEIAKWTPHLTYAIIHGPDKAWELDQALRNDVDIILMNYQTLKFFYNQVRDKYIRSFTRRTLILDESSMVKSHKTQRFKMLKGMLPLFTEYKFCLSATPAPGTYHELWSQYYMLDKGESLEHQIGRFRQKYCEVYALPDIPTPLYKVPARLRPLVEKAIAPLTFRLDAQDHLDMPEITYNKINLSLSKRELAQYKELEKELYVKIGDAEIEAFNVTSLSSKLRQFVQGGLYYYENDEDRLQKKNQKTKFVNDVKLKALKEMVESAAGQPILCAVQFKFEAVMLKKAFPKAPIIAGGSNPVETRRLIKLWNEGKIPLLICHPASLSHGVNLQHGGHILLWYALTWSLEHYLQLVGRLYRQGQSNAVIIHHFILANTVDVHVMKTLERKDAVQTGLLNYLRGVTESR